MKGWYLLVPTTVLIGNLSWIGLTSLDIHNNYNAPISYAVDSNPSEAIQQLEKVKTWMETEDIIAGNTCVFITSNPYCDLSNFYEQRVITSINESDDVINLNDPVAISNLSLKLNERFIGKGNKGSEYVKKPINLNLYLRWKNLSVLGWWIDFLCWSIVMFGIFVLALIGSED